MLYYDQKKDIINPKRCQSNVFKGWKRKVLLSFSTTYLINQQYSTENLFQWVDDVLAFFIFYVESLTSECSQPSICKNIDSVTWTM